MSLYAHTAGQKILEELDELKRESVASKHKIASLKTEVAALQESASLLRNKVDVLSQTSEGCLKTRRKSLDVYIHYDIVRDEPHICPMNTNTKTGDAALVFHGDCLADATLFLIDKRIDNITYRNLYGLESTQVLQFRMYRYSHIDMTCYKLRRCI